jgi:hypothetical protein
MPNMPISRRARQDIFDYLSANRIWWGGRLDDPAFLSRIWDLDDLPSTDYRYRTAYADIHQHTVNNRDWQSDWVFTDARFDLLSGPDETFLTFLSERSILWSGRTRTR